VYHALSGHGNAWVQLNSQSRILTTDWGRYDGRHVVFKPAGMTFEELQDGFYRAWIQTYGLRSILKTSDRCGDTAVDRSGGNLGFT